MKKIFPAILLFTAIALQSFSQTPDWSTSISSILYKHCTSCHHEGGLGPFPLITYEDALINSTNIQTYVNAKLMPPWPPDPNYTHLKDENVLSDYQLDLINNWVNNNSPEGDPYLAPAPPVYNGNSLMENPDETIHLPVFTIPFTGDLFWRFASDPGYTETKYLNSIEVVAGSPASVHHLKFECDTSNISMQDDLNYPGPGFPLDSGTSDWISPFMSQSEGRVSTLPANIGFEMLAGADYLTEVHYYTSTPNIVDSSKINLKFCTVPDVRVVSTSLLLQGSLPDLLDGPFEIPANTVTTFHLKSKKFNEDQSMIGFGPHAHLLCKSWLVYMITDLGDSIPLISIPNWNFDWQGGYMLTKVIKIPKGSNVYATVVYDNTSNNPNNPNDPPKDVHNGPKRTNEMAQVHFWLMNYQTGDEDIILDSAFYFPTIANFEIENENSLNIFPNPATENINVEYSNTNSDETDFNIYNQVGELVFSTINKHAQSKTNQFQINCSGFPPGIYMLNMRNGNEINSRKFVVGK